MNRFYLFSSWVAIFFIIITALFIISSCLYVLQLYLLNRKNKRFKKQNLEPGERKRNYSRNLKLSTKLDSKIKLASLSKEQTKRSKPVKSESNDVVDRPKHSSCFQTLFRIRQKRNQTKKDDFPELRNNLGDYLDGQTQSYESFETMTTDSECYRDWRHSIDFTNGGVLNLNNYTYDHNNAMMQRYEQPYAQEYQSRQSNYSLNKNQINKDEISIPVNDDLYPVSVLPYEFEPQPIHLYNPDKQQYNQLINPISQDDQLRDHKVDKIDKVDKEKNKKTNKKSSNRNNHSSLSSQNDDKAAISEPIVKKDTLVSVQSDGKVKLITSDLDRNMNLLTEN